MANIAMARRTVEAESGVGYQRHRPEQTLLYQIIERHYPVFHSQLAEQDRELLGYVQREFGEYLKCGRLERGFVHVRCDQCHLEHLAAFSCERCGFCPSCGARRMVDEVLPEQPMHQLMPRMACIRAMQEPLPKVLSFPYPLRFLLATRPYVMALVLGIVYRAIATHLVKRVGHTHTSARSRSRHTDPAHRHGAKD